MLVFVAISCIVVCASVHSLSPCSKVTASHVADTLDRVRADLRLGESTEIGVSVEEWLT